MPTINKISDWIGIKISDWIGRNTDTRNADISYAIEELKAHTPINDVLFEINNRAIARAGTRENSLAYSISVLYEAHDDLTPMLFQAGILQTPDRKSGIYSGEILPMETNNPLLAFQQIAPQKIIVHMSSDLSAPCPQGQHCTIHYNNGKGAVRIGQEREHPHSREKTR